MTSQTPLSLLLVGGTKTGKTHYGGQLLGRLNEKNGQLLMDGVAENIEPYEEVLRCLSEGRSAGHTPTTVYKESMWPVQIAKTEKRAKLLWPDYGGEQIRHLIDTRRVNTQWQQRIRSSEGWLLFIRLEHIRSHEDVTVRPRLQETMMQASRSPEQDVGPDVLDGSMAQWSDQAMFIELLQLFLFVKRIGTVRRVRRPALVVMLTCWDEVTGVKETMTPDALLSDRMPLFSSFLKANWEAGSLSIFGLSSLGKALDQKQSDEDYIDCGPQTQGWIILADGQRSSDLTIPVAHLIGLAEKE